MFIVRHCRWRPFGGRHLFPCELGPSDDPKSRDVIGDSRDLVHAPLVLPECASEGHAVAILLRLDTVRTLPEEVERINASYGEAQVILR